MNRIYLRNAIFVSIFLITLTSAVMNQSGPGGALTNAPGESNCTSCHSGTLVTSGTNHSNIFLTTGFQGGGYVPDSTYQIALSFKQSGIVKYGFQITALTSVGNSPIGTFGATNSRVQKYTTGNSRQFIGHTSSGTDTVSKDSTRWTFAWKAPSSNIGKIKFYVVVNATNNNGNENGDIIYGKTFEYSASPLLPVADATSIDSVTCTNFNAQLTGKGTNTPTSYSWKFNGANITTSTAQNPIVKFTTTTNTLAILTVKNKYGTSFPDTLKFNVRQSPNASIVSGTGGTICSGDSIQITANSLSGVTYKWNPSNKTSRSIFIKDTGSYNVTVTNTATGCSNTSANYKLSWYPQPTVSITKNSVKDSFCGQINETITANGSNLDSIYWYVNGKLFTKTKSFSYNFVSNINSNIYAVGKSVNKCLSKPSNAFNLIIVPKIFPTNFKSSKTTNSILMKWVTSIGIDSIKYSLNNINFFNTLTDTSILLNGLQPSTFYNIKIRSYQKGICKFTDTTLSIRTDNCSNISYSININSVVCKGDSIHVLINNLPKSDYSISYNNEPFTTDTNYSFLPLKSDSLPIIIIDSLNLTCPPINEKQAYRVDTFPNDPAIYTLNIASCFNTYTQSISPLYQKYEFYKNSVKVSSGTSNQFTHTGLKTGDILHAQVFINSCSKSLGPVNFTLSPSSNSSFTFSRNWKTYTFKPNDTSNVNYVWSINDTVVSTTRNLVMDMSAYNNKTATIKLKTSNFSSCTDSSEQIINFPNFLSTPDITNYQLNIFPNPFNQVVEITTNIENYQIVVYDNLGRIILQQKELFGNQILNCNDWEAGIYHIVLNNDKLRLNRVLTKVR